MRNIAFFSGSTRFVRYLPFERNCWRFKNKESRALTFCYFYGCCVHNDVVMSVGSEWSVVRVFHSQVIYFLNLGGEKGMLLSI